jgi:hypothetical protein
MQLAVTVPHRSCCWVQEQGTSHWFEGPHVACPPGACEHAVTHAAPHTPRCPARHNLQCGWAYEAHEAQKPAVIVLVWPSCSQSQPLLETLVWAGQCKALSSNPMLPPKKTQSQHYLWRITKGEVILPPLCLTFSLALEERGSLQPRVASNSPPPASGS